MNRLRAHQPAAQAPGAQAGAQEYLIIGGALGTVVAAGWGYTLYMASAMNHMDVAGMWMPPMPGGGWSLWDFWMLFSMWAIMMAAMMIPSAIPMVMVYTGLSRTRRKKGLPYTSVLVFVAGYLLAWMLFSLGISFIQWPMHVAGAMNPMMESSTYLLSGAVLIAAGIYQWTPYKNACLEKCRSPLGFLLNEWRKGTSGAVVMGLRHGLYCLGCCWALMLVLFAVGIMNVLWVLLIAGFVLVEKVMPAPKAIRLVSGAALVLWGGYWVYLHFTIA